MKAVGAGRAARRGIGGAAVLLGVAVLLSRLLGYVREAVLAYRAGAGPATDAYYAAFQIPDLLNYLLAGGALSIAFLPMYTRRREEAGREGAEELLALVLGNLGMVAVLATAVLWLASDALVALQFPRFDPHTQALTARLTRIVLPAQVFFLTGGIVNAALMAEGRFAAAAAAPLLYNTAIILGGIFLAPSLGVEGFSWGVLVGAAAGPLLAPLLDARGRIRVRWRLAPGDRRFLAYLAVAAPLMFGQTLLTVDEWYGRWFGALLGEGTVAQLGYARRIMMVPVAVVGQAIATAALPALSALWAGGRTAELNETVERTLKVGIVLAVWIAAFFVVLAEPAVRVVYERGAFTQADSAGVAAILSVVALAVPGWIAQQIGSRAFYARGDTWRPMVLGTAVALLSIPLYLALGRRLGAPGLAAAGVVGITANAWATLALARRLHGAPALAGLIAVGLRAALMALPAAAAAAVAAGWSGGAGVWGALLALGSGAAAFAGVLFGGLRLAGDPTGGDVVQRLSAAWSRALARLGSRG